MQVRCLMTVLAAVLMPLAAQAGHDPAIAASTADTTVILPDYVTSAINDPARKGDRVDDERRKMRAVMAFANVKPGDVVVELLPGSGYWTRVFSRIVGSEGHVYTIWPDEESKYTAKSMAHWRKLAQTPHYANVSVLAQPGVQVSVPVKADVVFTSQNYHDYHNFIDDMAVFNRHVYQELKPGGVFIVIDHVAPTGSGASTTDSLHRIDPVTVEKELEATGFIFAGSSNALSNPADPHDVSVFDDSIRGHTDQFMFRFRKPAD